MAKKPRSARHQGGGRVTPKGTQAAAPRAPKPAPAGPALRAPRAVPLRQQGGGQHAPTRAGHHHGNR